MFFHIFNYCNFDIGIFVLRLSCSVQVSKKLFGINKPEGPNKHCRVAKQ